eukprot:SAG22_NODE_1726_length_3712_cov_4.345143_1_plen_235_part_10
MPEPNTSRSITAGTAEMSADEKYLFDLVRTTRPVRYPDLYNLVIPGNPLLTPLVLSPPPAPPPSQTGYLIVRDVLTPEQLRIANEGIDQQELSNSPSYTRGSGALTGAGTSTRLGNTADLMGMPQPYCQPFRDMLALPALIPYLNTILGEGWRLDHGPGLIAMDKGCEGGQLHGSFDNAPYFYREGKIFTGLIVVEFLLHDEGPGDGGVCVVPGAPAAPARRPPPARRRRRRSRP